MADVVHRPQSSIHKISESGGGGDVGGLMTTSKALYRTLVYMCAHSLALRTKRERERRDDRMHVQPQPTNRAPNEFHCGLCCHETNPADVPTRMGFKSLYTILAPSSCACVCPFNWCSTFKLTDPFETNQSACKANFFLLRGTKLRICDC